MNNFKLDTKFEMIETKGKYGYTKAQHDVMSQQNIF